QALKLVAITGQRHEVQPVVLRPSRPLDPQEDLDRPTPHPVPDQLLQGRLHRRKLVADLGAELEMPVVDRPDLDQDRPALVLLPGLSKTGHAQEQGSLAGSRRRGYQTNRAVPRGESCDPRAARPDPMPPPPPPDPQLP